MADSSNTPNPSARKQLTAERLRELLHYDPETGLFTRLVDLQSRGQVGQVAGGITSNGYISIRAESRLYQAHRLAWLYMTGEWPAHEVDHRDGVRHNNRWSNLREATDAQNCWNAKQIGPSGFKGVSFFKPRQKWRARIAKGGKFYFLGYFDTAEAAFEAYKEAAASLHGEFARFE